MVERVNHLTGEMEAFGFCSRHTPPRSFLDRCASAKDLTEWRVHTKKTGHPGKARHAETDQLDGI